ncbi:MAG: hypothetical protein ACD_9C00051G0002 [uncultured bacterium]|nr:MAG: hypothetical protein ACD_9C00051G0002 [uncultured bacterium]
MKIENKKKNIFLKNKSGFSLVEALVAVFIFALTITMLTSSFSNFLKTFANAKKIQKSTESAQYAMNLMAKTIRSSMIDPIFVSGGNQIKLFDYSSSKCVIYKYETGTLKIATAGDNGASIVDISNCNLADAPALANFYEITKAGEISSTFFVGQPSINGSRVGKVSIVSSVLNGDAIQITISLRQ